MTEFTQVTLHPSAEFGFRVALTAAGESECIRSRVGAALQDAHGRTVAVGWNSGETPCSTCPRSQSDVPPGSSYDTGPGTCIALHAEQRVVLDASADSMRGGTLYVTRKPCDGCERMLKGSGLKEVRYL